MDTNVISMSNNIIGHLVLETNVDTTFGTQGSTCFTNSCLFGESDESHTIGLFHVLVAQHIEPEFSGNDISESFSFFGVFSVHFLKNEIRVQDCFLIGILHVLAGFRPAKLDTNGVGGVGGTRCGLVGEGSHKGSDLGGREAVGVIFKVFLNITGSDSHPFGGLVGTKSDTNRDLLSIFSFSFFFGNLPLGKAFDGSALVGSRKSAKIEMDG